MTVSTTTSSVSYSANGTQTTFAYTFKIFEDGDLLVILRNDTTGVETTQTLTTDYTVTNAGNDLGGNVVFGTAPADGNTVFIRRNIPATQLTDYVENDPFPAEAHENALDKLTMLVQQNTFDEDRAILFPESEAGSGLTNVLPSVSNRQGQLLSFAADGSVAVTSPSSLGQAIIGANYAIDSFTGTGSTTVYSLSASPGSTNNTSVYIDGVYQQKANYSVNGTTLTFTTAPPLNSAIEVVVGDAIPAGSATAASAVTFTQSGAGAQQTNVQAKLQESVSVKDFGAVGDGVTDDSAAFQSAITQGGVVFIPEGTYLFNSAVTISNPVTLVGSGQSATNLHRNYSPVADTDGIFNIRDGGSLVAMRDMTLRSLSGQTGGCLLSIVNTDAQAIGQMSFINMGFTTTGSETHEYTIYMDGTARTSTPIGIRGVDMVGCSVFGGATSTILVKGILKFSFLGGGCYQAGGASGSNIDFDGVSGVKTQSFQFLPADCSCDISFDYAKLGVFSCGTMGAVTNTSNTENIVGYGFTGTLQQNWSDSIFINTSTGIRMTYDSGISNDGTASGRGLFLKNSQISGYAETPSATTRIGHAGIGYTTSTTNGQTFSFDTQSGKLFWIAYGGGDAALVFADYKSSTITLLANPSSAFEASSTPTAGKTGLYKNVNSHTIFVENNTGVATNYVICSLGPSLNPVDPA